jgi:hypothetical protein
MKTFEGRGLTADQIALYQRLEAQRYPGFNAKNPAHWLLGVGVWPAVFMRNPKTALVILFAGLLVGASQAWKSPAVLTGLLLGGAAVVMTSKARG